MEIKLLPKQAESLFNNTLQVNKKSIQLEFGDINESGIDFNILNILELILKDLLDNDKHILDYISRSLYDEVVDSIDKGVTPSIILKNTFEEFYIKYLEVPISKRKEVTTIDDSIYLVLLNINKGRYNYPRFSILNTNEGRTKLIRENLIDKHLDLYNSAEIEFKHLFILSLSSFEDNVIV